MADARNELAFVDWLRARTPANARVPIGPGDDAAAIDFPAGSRCLVTTDMLLDGACFRLESTEPRRIGRKAMAVNLSDIAAMAGRPLAALVSLALPKSADIQMAQELFLGIEEMAERFSTTIIGGDTNTWEGPLAISVTLLGEATERGPVRRSGARVGDWIFVTGHLGGSILGHHLDFTPRVAEALAVHASVQLHAMIDISDGFSLDLSRVTQASGLGAVIQRDRIPVSDAAKHMSDGVAPLDHALCDGEDFELIFMVSPADGRRLLAGIAGIKVFHVGECVERGLWFDNGSALVPRGYEHRFEKIN